MNLDITMICCDDILKLCTWYYYLFRWLSWKPFFLLIALYCALFSFSPFLSFSSYFLSSFSSFLIYSLSKSPSNSSAHTLPLFIPNTTSFIPNTTSSHSSHYLFIPAVSWGRESQEKFGSGRVPGSRWTSSWTWSWRGSQTLSSPAFTSLICYRAVNVSANIL